MDRRAVVSPKRPQMVQLGRTMVRPDELSPKARRRDSRRPSAP